MRGVVNTHILTGEQQDVIKGKYFVICIGVGSCNFASDLSLLGSLILTPCWDQPAGSPRYIIIPPPRLFQTFARRPKISISTM